MLQIDSLKKFITELNQTANSTFNDYINRYNSNGYVDSEELKYFLLCLDRAYTDAISPIRDEDYDILHSIYEDITNNVIRGDMVKGNKITHRYPKLKGTIRKCHYITERERIENSNIKTHKSLEKWIYDSLFLLPNTSPHTLMISPKYDGVSMIVEVVNGEVESAITRGDAELNAGEDKTELFKLRKFNDPILSKDNIGIKFECIMDTPSFEEYNKKYGNDSLVDERTAINSILTSNFVTDNQMSYVSLVPLMYELDGKVYPYKSVYDRYVTIDPRISTHESITNDIRNAITEVMSLIKTQMKFKCDGIVVRFINENDVDILGRDEEACVNNYERAYKFPPETAESELLDVIQDIGLLGKVSFTANVKPVKLKNKIIKSISLGSKDRVETLDLHIGDIVLVKYDIIPYLTKLKTNEKGKKVEVITHCPICGELLEMNPELMCVNTKCPSRIIGKIYNWCNRLNIENIGEETIKTLFNHGLLTNIDSLYKLDEPEVREKILSIEGFGEVKYTNMIESIIKANSVPDYLFLGSIGIPSISTKIFRKVLEEIPFNEFYKLVFDFNNRQIIERKLLNIPGIKHKTCNKIINGMIENKDLIDTILNHIKIIRSEKLEKRKSIVFSGIRNKEFERYLEELGFDISDSINKDTYMLMVKDLTSTSSKITKARKMMIPVIDIGRGYNLFKFKP